jgi:dipeptidyl aminopeptidase/acylaminoacyl peptidase
MSGSRLRLLVEDAQVTRTNLSNKRALTADDLFQITVVSDPQASLDGTMLAWVQTRPDKEQDTYRGAIWIANADGSAPRQLTSGQFRDQHPRWAPDGKTLLLLSNRPPVLPPAPSDDASAAADTAGGKPPTQVWTIRIDGGEAAQVSSHPNGASDPEWSPDGKAIVFVAQDDVTESDRFSAATSVGPIADERIVRDISYRFDGRGFLEKYAHLWIVDIGGGARQLTFGDANDASPAWSPDGSTIAFSANRAVDRRRAWNVNAIHTVPAAGGEVSTLTPEDSQFSNPAWSPVGDRLAFLGHRGTSSADNDTVWTVHQDGSALVNETEATDLSFGDSGMSDLSGSSDGRPQWLDNATVLALASTRGESQVHAVKVGKGKVEARTSGEHRIAGFAPIGRDLAILRGTIARPFEIERWSGKKLAGPISHANDAFLDEVALIDARPLPVSAPDGREIQAWLIPPAGLDDTAGIRHSLILQIHGGPHSMYGFAMFHEMQLMAARGYGVVFCNPRGSAGYGQEFTSCTRGIWGEADMPDVLAAVESASTLPWVDTDRLGVTGGSYGGYLTNWIIGHDTRFKAAVTQRCVSNFHSFFGTSDIGSTFGVHEFDGLPWSDTEKLLRHSPIAYVEQMQTPLLILHSEQDLRCPIEQAEQLFASLKYLDREVSFVRIPDEGHELSRSGTPGRRMARLHHLIGWFDQHL